jgi:type IV pilus assembly protein PilE
MTNSQALPLPSSRGFTLVELMVTIAIVAMLAAIAVPTYQAQIRKSRRTEARSALLDTASREERFFATNNKYTQTATDLGYASFPAPVGNSYYTLSVVCNDKPCATGFTATAAPVSTSTQAKDLS